MLLGDVGLVTCLPGFTLSGGVKCVADEDFVPVDLSQCVRHEVAVCLLKCREHHVLQKRCFSREMPHTLRQRVHRRWILLSCVSQDLVVGLLLLNPPIIPMLPWCMSRMCRFLVILVTPYIRETCHRQLLKHANEVAELTEYVTLTCCQSRHSRLVPLSGVSEDRAFTLEKYGLSRRKYLVPQRSFAGMDH